MHIFLSYSYSHCMLFAYGFRSLSLDIAEATMMLCEHHILFILQPLSHDFDHDVGAILLCILLFYPLTHPPSSHFLSFSRICVHILCFTSALTVRNKCVHFTSYLPFLECCLVFQVVNVPEASSIVLQKKNYRSPSAHIRNNGRHKIYVLEKKKKTLDAR